MGRGAANNQETGSTGVLSALAATLEEGTREITEPAAHQSAAVGKLCSLGFHSGADWNLRSNCVCGGPANPGNRRADGAGSSASRSISSRDHSWSVVNLGWSLAWPWLWRSQDPRRTALWDYCSRSSHFGRCRCSLGLRWSAGLLYSCPSHGQGRSHRSIAIRVTADP